jgi:hypothetical protein
VRFRLPFGQILREATRALVKGKDIGYNTLNVFADPETCGKIMSQCQSKTAFLALAWEVLALAGAENNAIIIAGISSRRRKHDRSKNL